MFNRGVNETAQKCHNSIAPTLQQGVTYRSQKCHALFAPALQKGVMGTAQKCQNHTASTLQQGAIALPQKCHTANAPALFWCHSIIALCRILSAPMGRVTSAMQQCRLAITLPNHSTGGHLKHAEMPPIMHPRLTTGSQIFYAEMPRSPRSHFIWCRSEPAEMP